MGLGSSFIVWGNPEIIQSSPWTDNGTPTVTPGQTDPLGGANAVLIEDNDVGGFEARLRDNLTFVQRTGTLQLGWWVRQGTSAGFRIALRDQTAAVYRGIVVGTWTAGIPALFVAAGTVTPLTPLQFAGTGWWFCRVLIDGVFEASTHRMELYPSGNAASDTGTTYFYLNRTVLLDVPDTVQTYAVPRDGSESVQGPSGIEDAWIVGWDYEFAGDIRWVPRRDVDSPVSISGWEGQGEYTFAQVGVLAMLRQLAEKQQCTIAFDRVNSSLAYSGAYLKAPIGEPPAPEANGTLSFRLVLRHPTYPFQGIP